MRAMQSITLTAAAVALLAFSVPVATFADMHDMSMKEQRAGHGHMMATGSMEKMDDMMGMCIEHAQKIGLSDEQLAKVKPMHREMQKKQARFKADLKIAEIDLMEIMDVKDFDLEKANAAVYKIADLKTAHHLEMLKAMKTMRTVLTDDQFKKMNKEIPMKHSEGKAAKKHHKK